MMLKKIVFYICFMTLTLNVLGSNKFSYAQLFYTIIKKNASTKYASQGTINKTVNFTNTFASDFNTLEKDKSLNNFIITLKNGDSQYANLIANQSNLPDSLRLLINARMQVLNLNFEKAEEHYEKLYELCKNNPNVINEYANFCLMEERFFMAKNLYVDALKGNLNTEKETSSRLSLAYIYQLLGSSDLGIKEITTALEKIQKQENKNTSKKVQAYKLIGEFYTKEHEYNSAIKYFQDALALLQTGKNNNQSKLEIYEDLSNMFIDQGEIDLALDAANKACELIKQDENQTQYNIAKSYVNWAKIYFNSGQYDQASTIFSNAQSLLEKQAESVDNKILLADIQSYVARINVIWQDYNKANKIIENVMSIYEDKALDNNSLALIGKAKALEIMGTIAQRQHDFAIASKKLNESLELINKLNNISNNEYLLEKSTTLSCLGQLYSNMDNTELAIEKFKESCYLLERLSNKTPGLKPDYAQALNLVGNQYRKDRNIDSTLYYLHSSFDIYNQIINKTIRQEVNYSHLLNNMAVAYRSIENSQVAMNYYELCYQIRKKLYAHNNEYQNLWAEILNNYGLFHVDLNDYEMALYYLNLSKDMRIKLYEANPKVYKPTLADSYDNLAYTYNLNVQTDSSILYYQKSLEIRRELSQSSDVFTKDYIITLSRLSNLYRRIGMLNQALDGLLEIKKTYLHLNKTTLNDYFLQIADINHNIALVYGLTEKIDKAISLMDSVVIQYQSLSVKQPEIYSPQVADCMNQLANYYSDLENYDMALKYYNKAIELKKQNLKEGYGDKADLASSYNNLGLLYFQNKNMDKAIQNYTLAQTLFNELISLGSIDMQTAICCAMNQLNIIQYNIKAYQNAQKVNIELCTQAMLILENFIENKSAQYYYNYASKLKNQLQEELKK